MKNEKHENKSAEKKSGEKKSAEKKSGLLPRSITLFVGIPLVVFLVTVESERFLWPLNVVMILVSVFSTIEAAKLLKLHKVYNVGNFMQNAMLVCIGIAFPLIAFFWVLQWLTYTQLFMITVFIFMAILILQIFFRQEDLAKITHAVCLHITLAVYPGILLGHVIMISALPSASNLYIVMLSAIIFNDTMAYLAGQIYKMYKNLRDNPTPLSPNKTWPGFIVGFLFSPLTVFLWYRINPQLFPGGQRNAIVLGIIIGLCTILGDLVESGLKRSVKMKDSGEVIPGRGGLLDSVDSIIFTAPLFFYCYQWFNAVWVI